MFSVLTSRRWCFARGRTSGAPLCTPHVGAQLPHPQRGGRSAPPPRVTFSPMRKSPKNLPEGGPSGYSPWGALSSPQQRAALLPPERGATPGSPQKQNLTAMPRIESRKCLPVKLREKKRPICPQTQSGKSVYFCGTNPFEGVAGTAGGAKRPPQGVQGRSPGTPLVPFVVKRKEPRVWAG